MNLFDLYRGGYALGSEHGQRGQRRRSRLELAVSHPLTWLPGADQESLMRGYAEGYRDGAAIRALAAHGQRHRRDDARA